jgi:hypothetical protein
MDDRSRQKLVSLDDLVAEVQALHSRVSQLERELARVRIETTVPRAGGREPVEGWATPHPAVSVLEAASTEATPDSPVRQVLTADDDTAARHLERLRASITRLREERARAAAEFRMLTRPRLEGEPTTPGPLPSEAPGAEEPAAPTLAVVEEFTAHREHREREVSPAAPVEPAVLEVAPVGAEVAAALVEQPAAARSEASPTPGADARPVASAGADRAVPGGVDISTSFPTLAAARQALDDYAARLPSSTAAESARVREGTDARAPVEEAPDDEWRRVRAAALDAELERNEIRRRRRLLRAVAMIGSVLLIGAAALALQHWLRSRGDEASVSAANRPVPALDVRADTASAPPEPAMPQAESTSAPVAASSPVGTTGSETGVAAAPPRVELRTTREVWLRTSVDCQPFRERLVPANEVLQFNPTRTLYVRAGDAGGLRVFIDGEDRGLLGSDGRVVTRNFPIPARTEPVR